MLKKDIKDIIEGVHYFLEDGLKTEKLSGKAECMRRGLLLQLELLHRNYPTLQFSITDTNHNRPTSIIQYYNEKNVLNKVNNSCGLSTSSGGSANYEFSNGYSNESSMGSSGDGVIASTQNASDDELYEQCEDNTKTSKQLHEDDASTINDSTIDGQSGNIVDDSYASEIEIIPFRINIACCDNHGVLVKKSRSFLKNSSYHCVLSNSMLYLYRRESDDRQRKVIDLHNYKTRSVESDDKKKKEFAFELYAPGKKTHTFSCTSQRDRDDWIKCLTRCVSVNTHNGSLLEHYANDGMDEVYEELSNDHPEAVRSNNSSRDSLGAYYELPEENKTDDPKTEADKRRPERPPLPQILKDLKQQNRPLPVTPSPDHEPAIYYEIECDESFDNESTEEVDSVLDLRRLHSRSLSQEIFDTINERVLSESEPGPGETFEYDVPAEINLVIRETHLIHPDHVEPSEDSEYQVPSSHPVPNIYQVPPAPVPVKITAERATPSNETAVEDEQASVSTKSSASDSKKTFPSNSVKELIAKLNRSDNIPLRSSLRQTSPPKMKLVNPEIEIDPNPTSSMENCEKKSSLLSSEIGKLKHELKMKLCAGKDAASSDICIAKFAYVGTRINELSFSRGDAILVTDSPADSMWWKGIAKGKTGLVQKAYLRKLQS